MNCLKITIKHCIVPIIALFVLNVAATGQNNSIKIKGEILDGNAVGISDCYIKVAGVNSRIIYNYINAGRTNTFALETTVANEDRLAITVSSIGYEDTVLYCSTTVKSIYFNVVLRIKYHILDGVVIKTPPIWHRGDTTSYNVNSFADGDERKLKDILEKMPGFEISADGELRYKRKVINTILIDGEELFSDKIALLLKNFPAHVLKNIQAIQNQSDNKLLKGLTGDGNTVLNLGLNKDKQKALFGDGEVGIGTAKKYSISPVLFSLLGKVKGGFIGNWNNIGNGIDWRQLYELKNEPERLAGNWLKNNISVQLIPEFENRWYINNGQWDNRLQINVPISKRLKSKTEINYFKDRQYQNSYATSSFYNGSNFYLRNDSNEIGNKPGYLKLRETLTWSVDSIRELKFINEYFNDNTRGYQNTVYNQNGILSYLSNSIANTWGSIASRAEYTHRKSESTAYQSFVQLNYQNQSQASVGQSPNWPAIYNLTNSEYNMQYQTASNKVNAFKAGLTQLKSIKKRKVEMGLVYNRIAAILHDSVFINDAKKTLPGVAPTDLNNFGKYTINKISGSLKRNYTFINENTLSLDAATGFSNAVIKEKSNHTSITTPEYDLHISYRTHFLKTQPFIDFYISQSQAAPYELFTYLKPISGTYYSKHQNLRQPLKTAKIEYTQPLGLLDGSHGNFRLSYSRNFSSFASINTVNNFLSFESDSIVNVPTYSFNISTSQQIPSLVFNAVIRLNAGFTQSSVLIANSGQILSGQSNNTFINLSFRKNWNRKYYIDLKSDINLNNFKLPKSIAGSISPKVLNFKNSLAQRFVFNKKMYVRVNSSVFSNNLFTDNRASFLFVDVEYNIKMPKSPVAFTIRGENLSNTKFFYRSYTYSSAQSFYNVPLIKRRVFISFKYDL